MKETKIGMKIEEETKSIKKMCDQLGKSIEYQFDKGIEQIDTEEMKEAVDMLKDFYAMKKDIIEACYYKQIMEAMEESEYGEDYDEEGPMEEGRRGYRGQPRSESGRFMSRGDGRRSNRGGRGRGRRGYEEVYDEMEEMRDMDMMNGRMYYSGGGSSSGGGSQGGSSGQSSGGSSMGSSNGGSMGYSESGSMGSGSRQGQQRDSREGRSGQSRRSYMETKEMNKGNSPQEKDMKLKELDKYMNELSSDISEMITDSSNEEKTMLKQKLNTLVQKIQ